MVRKDHSIIKVKSIEEDLILFFRSASVAEAILGDVFAGAAGIVERDEALHA